jgi:4-alpha-glucanotransferase
VDWLAEAGQTWWQMLPLGPPDRYGSPYKAKSAFAASPALLADPSAPVSKEEELSFREREAFWIEDWIALGGRDALADQVRFDRECAAIRTYAAERGVRLIGDIPIYVAPESADHVAHRELFKAGMVSGAPPDRYTELGQLWGNPLYDWPALQRRRYRWWTERFRRVFELVDVARIDHFRGFVAYWAVPETDEDARRGTWKRGPGRAPFDAARRELGEVALIAEDLGVITPPVEKLRDALGLPGMVVLQFGYDPDDPTSPHRVARHVEHSVVYTGTHDHDTVRGWYEAMAPAERAEVDADTLAHGFVDPEPEWRLIRLASSSRASLAMVQIQDVLGLGSEARMNMPGAEGGQWTWRLEPGQLTASHAERLREVTAAAGRLPS